MPKKITPRHRVSTSFLPFFAARFYLRFADYLARRGHKMLMGAIPKRGDSSVDNRSGVVRRAGLTALPKKPASH
jgi:hypothetical protein